MSRWRGSVLSAVLVVTFILYIRSPLSSQKTYPHTASERPSTSSPDKANAKFNWADVPQQFPVTSMKAVPTITSSTVPRIQHEFKRESTDEKRIRQARLQQVKGNFTHAWRGYKEHAWLRDEVKPISGGSEDPFGGWAASMVDSLGLYPLQITIS